MLNAMLLVNLILFSYAIVPVGWWPCTMIVLAITSAVLIGMRSLAVQLANPFGEDAVDFEIENFLQASYINAVAHLQEPKHDPHCFDDVGLPNPLATETPGKVPGDDEDTDDVDVVEVFTGGAFLMVKSPRTVWAKKINDLRGTNSHTF